MFHELKTWPKPFAAVISGEKKHEIRKQDRPFAVGDILRLREWDPVLKRYTGRETSVDVTYFTGGGEWGLPNDVCVMSIDRRWTEDDEFTFAVIQDARQGVPCIPVLVVDAEKFGSLSCAFRWLRENEEILHKQTRLVILAPSGGDLSDIPPVVGGIVHHPTENSKEAWRRAIAPMVIGTFHPEHHDRLDPAKTMGGVSMEEFKEHIRAHNAGESDDGGTC